MFTFRTRHRRTRRGRSPRGMTCLAVACALVLFDPGAFPVPSAQADDDPPPPPRTWDFDPHIVFASGAATQAVTLLVANAAHRGDEQRCRFEGLVRAQALTAAAYGGSLDDLLFEPLSLAPGEALAIDLPPPGTHVVPSQVRVLVMAIEPFDAVSASCPLLVQAMAYETGSGATQALIDRYTFGVEKSFGSEASTRPGPERSIVPLGFVGGSADQAARLVLVRGGRDLPSAELCDFSGEVVAQVAPRLVDAPDDTGRTIENAWPIDWQGPSPVSLGTVEIPFEAFAVPGDPRADVLLSLRFEHAPPAACMKQIDASLQVLDRATGETRTVMPADRLFFNYHLFNN